MVQAWNFPHQKIREVQHRLITKVEESLKMGKSLLCHAPTGIGKTAGVLYPCIKYAEENDMVVYFLTSRHTQHAIALETIKKIQETNNIKIRTVDLVGKKWLCLQPGIHQMNSGEFGEYCKGMKENKRCEYYINTYSNPHQQSVRAKRLMEELGEKGAWSCEEAMEQCHPDKLCPYEIIISLSKDAKVVIADYNYIFNSRIQENFFTKIQKSLNRSIIIIDEGHNLPKRIREMLSEQLSFQTIKRAIKETEQFSPQLKEFIVEMQQIMRRICTGMHESDEKLMTKSELVDHIERLQLGSYEQLIDKIEKAGEDVLTEKKQSSLASIAQFLMAWPGEDEGFARILTMKSYQREVYPVLSYRNLDPAIVSGPIVTQSHCTILMSGTLHPPSMYKDVLGFPTDAFIEKYESPFPKNNILNLLVPLTTTKYSERSETQFKKIADILVQITDLVPGNSAVFFPSYSLRDNIYKYVMENSKKTCMLEQAGMHKAEKAELLHKFKEYEKTGAVLYGVTSGSFGEGIDLPGDLLKCVIVVGLPLERPDLETKELISYYEKKFGKGWDYGYVIPAFNRALQNAGRCIRSEKDRGVIVFLDERYTQNMYYKHFPKEWDLKITALFSDRIRKFYQHTSV